MDNLKPVFDQIRADEALRQNTLVYVETHRRPPRRFYAPAVSAACILVLLLGGTWLYYTPTARVSIDLEVPLTLEVNRFDRVISASGSGSQTILSDLELTHLAYSDAMNQILSSATVTEHLSNGEIMTVSVIAPEGEQSARLLTDSQACTGANCYYADPDTAQEAKELDLPLGKYRVFLELQALDPSVTADDIRDLTMRQIRDWINRLLQPDPELPPADPAADPTETPAEAPTEVPTSPGHHGQGNGNGQGSGNGQGNGQGNGNGHGKQK